MSRFIVQLTEELLELSDKQIAIIYVTLEGTLCVSEVQKEKGDVAKLKALLPPVLFPVLIARNGKLKNGYKQDIAVSDVFEALSTAYQKRDEYLLANPEAIKSRRGRPRKTA
jgi:hypothetical protein